MEQRQKSIILITISIATTNILIMVLFRKLHKNYQNNSIKITKITMGWKIDERWSYECRNDYTITRNQIAIKEKAGVIEIRNQNTLWY